MKLEYKFYVEDPGLLPLSGIVERLGAIVAYYRGSTSSTHERTKEVWGALNLLLKLPERKWSTWIPIIVEQFAPDFGSQKDTEYFKKLLRTLLLKFSDEVRGYSPSAKMLLAKSIRSALDSASGSPYPQICFFVKEGHPERLNPPDERFKSCIEVVGYESNPKHN